MYISGIMVGNIKHVFINPRGPSPWRLDDLNAPENCKVDGGFEPLSLMASFVENGQAAAYIPVGEIHRRLRECFDLKRGPAPSSWIGDRLRGEAQI